MPLPLPALADQPKCESNETGHGASAGNGGAAEHWLHEPRGAGRHEPNEASVGSLEPLGSSAHGGDWRLVLYHDRNVILYNPSETPPLRTRRLSLEEASGSSTLSGSYGRCPLCRQTIDARFAFAAQAYFDLLQGVFRSTRVSATHETSEEVDLLTETDLYRILAIPRNAKLDDIKRAYRKRSLRYHPDKNLDDPDAKLKFQKVAEAFSVLSDENKRSKYDNSGDMDLDDFDVEQFMNMVNSSGLKYRKSANADMDMEDVDVDVDQVGDMMGAIGDGLPMSEENNPFLLAPPPEAEVPVMASEGGAEEEAAAAASLRNLPSGLLNTGYYARFFHETKPLGAGTFGAVYLCRHVLDDLTLGDYAVKKVPVGDNKAWLRDMIREVKTFERLHHPNIVEYKHSWLELDRRSPFCPFVPFLFILMQYCNGGSLEELIWHEGNPARRKVPLAVALIWHLLQDILGGLQHLHRQGILHRDLKPTNILLQKPYEAQADKRGSGRSGQLRALLSDFGTSAPFGEPPASSHSRGYTGTVEYTAPELLPARGEPQNEYTEKSDMWSLGIVLYAMCFSKLPFSHDDPHVLKGLIRRFVEERLSGPDDSANEASAEEWLPDDHGRLGPLRLVLSALLTIDTERRPTASDLLENPVFRSNASKFARRNGESGDYAAISDS